MLIPHNDRRRGDKGDKDISLQHFALTDSLDCPSPLVSEISVHNNMDTLLQGKSSASNSNTYEPENESNWLSNGDLGAFWDDFNDNLLTIAENPLAELYQLEADYSLSAFDREALSFQSFNPTGVASPLQVSISTSDAIPTSQHLTNEIDRFFDELYPVYPIINKDSLYQRIASNDTESDSHFQMLLLAIPMINLGRSYRKMPSDACKIALQTQIATLEQRRTEYDFAETPNLDTVVVSFLLFCATNVLVKHNRAFLYLSEARDMLGFVAQQMREQHPNNDDLRRSARIELTLFIAEAATYSIYGAGSCYRRGRTLVDSSIEILQEKAVDDDLERCIDNLLLRLTAIHVAATWPPTRESQGDSIESFVLNSTASFDLPCLTINQVDRHTLSYGSLTGIQKQTADIVITTDWRSIEILAASVRSRQGLDSQRRLIQTLWEKSSSALASSCALDEGFLRVVGIGKLALMACNIRNILITACGTSGLDQRKNLLAGLVFTVVKTDYEGSFATMLRDCIDLVSGVNNIRPPPSHILPQIPGRLAGNDSAQLDEVFDDEGYFLEEASFLPAAYDAQYLQFQHEIPPRAESLEGAS